MTDFDFWKKKYQASWGQSSKREAEIAAKISQETGKEIDSFGLGAGSAELLSGSAAQQGHKKGDPDFKVVGTNIFLEITGPLVDFIDERDPLWVRPDKIQNAKKNADHETWVVHHLSKNGLIRVLPLDEDFWRALADGDFPIVTPRIRGVKESYHEIPAAHRCVKPYHKLVERLSKT